MSLKLRMISPDSWPDNSGLQLVSKAERIFLEEGQWLVGLKNSSIES
jgi:hypothetical protein